MEGPPSLPSPLSVVIAVADGALATALEIVLQACGITPLIHPHPESLSQLQLNHRSLLIVDHDLLPSHPREFVAGLRAGGYDGAVVLLSEGLTPKPYEFRPADNVTVLTKPFVGAALAKIIELLLAASD